MTNKNTYNLLSQINIPADLRRLPIDKLPQVCEEIAPRHHRQVSRQSRDISLQSLGCRGTDGRFALCVRHAYDRIVWDVGHQAYGHKILTRRRGTFLYQRGSCTG